MHLSSFLHPDLVLLGESFSNEADMIKRIVPLMIQGLKLKQPSSEIEDLFLTREAQSPTAYPAGIGIPHIRLEHIHAPVLAIVVPKTPLVIYNVTVKMFVLIITDITASKLYLNIVKALLSIAKEKELFEELCNYPDPDEVIGRIRHKEVEILNEITVKDIMNKKYTAIPETTTLKELGDLIEETQSEFFPVVNSRNEVVGEVTLSSYLQVGIPKYTLLLENVKFPQTIEPLEDIFRNENTMTVKDIMTTITYRITTTSSISEAVFQMVKRQSRHITIFEDNQIAGILSIFDIFKKVIRG
jgi:mannitol/fructose-specific phosphotransferase system IIA component (Ntr-type)/predicted transcriptional regulator